MISPINNFDETRPEFKGFNSFYINTLLPFLEVKERERVGRVSKAKKVGAAIGGLGLLFSTSAFTRIGVLEVILAVISIIAGFATPHIMLSKLKGETKQFLMGNICEFLGWTFQTKEFENPDLGIWQDNKLLPRFDRVSFEDQMQGNSHGADFSFCEAKLETKHTDSNGKTEWRTTFAGIILHIDFHMKFLGRTVVLRDAGIFNRKKKAGMKRVGLVDPKFEKLFEAYGTDQVEARYLLTPTFMQRLVDLETTVGGKKIRFGFMDGKLYIALEAPNQFEAGSMFKPLIDSARTEKILAEIGSILDIIDGVLKPLKKRKY